MRRLSALLVGAALLFACLALPGNAAAAASAYRPLVILHRMDLSGGALSGVFSIGKSEKDGTPQATGTVENDATRGKVLHISNRAGSSAGLSVALAETRDAVGTLQFAYQNGALTDGEFYSLTFSIRAEPGKHFYIMPVLGGGGVSVWNDDKSAKLTDHNGYLGNPEARFEVTDRWTTIGVSADGVLECFCGDETYRIYQPNPASWCSLYFVTFTDPAKGIWDTPCSDGYYLSDLCFWGPKAIDATAAGFVDGVGRLPAADQTSRSVERTIDRLTAVYNGLSAADRQRADVASAKKILDAARSAMQTVRTPYRPNYTMRDPTNLLAPYGDLEAFDGSTYIWSEPATGAPKFTLVNDKSVAKQGSQCLLVSGRNMRGDVSIDLTSILRAKGGGKYYFSCWMKTREPGMEAEVLPLLLYVNSETDVTEYEIGEAVITDEWTFVGVTIQEADRFFVSNGEGLRDPSKVNYAVLRFYTTNVQGEDETDLFPDYYIDDLKFWKDSELLPGYTPAETVSSVPATSSSAPVASVEASSEPTAAPSNIGPGLLLGIAAGVAVLAVLFVLFWFLLRPKMLAAAAGTGAPPGTEAETPAPSAEPGAEEPAPEDTQTETKE